jgi:hypothetical protein
LPWPFRKESRPMDRVNQRWDIGWFTRNGRGPPEKIFLRDGFSSIPRLVSMKSIICPRSSSSSDW